MLLESAKYTCGRMSDGSRHTEDTYHDCAIGNCWDGHSRDTIQRSIAPFRGGVCGYVPKSLVQGVSSISHTEW